MRRGPSLDLSIYAKGLGLLVRNPVIFIFPLIAGLFDIAMGFLKTSLFDPIGGNDFGLTTLVTSIGWGFGFALSMIAAETAWRNRKPTLSTTWNDGQRKAGDILMATIGFLFMIFVAGMLAGFVPIPFLGLLLQIAALFFLIYSIPAAAIGGVPGGAALQASIERVRGNYAGAAVLSAITIVLAYLFVVYSPYLTLPLGVFARYGLPFIQAIIVAYLAVVYARQYDDVSFFRPH